ncbi:MAG: pilus assembly PilX N-terminal domain-containing protein [Candidatus Levybacteria bacterium]|nr:pilus assembly PilX N-terminal domain-containing protein [Candidatus Levybacteria bacterium]
MDMSFQANPLQKGQLLLIVILIMTVALTVGLSITTRSITNLRVTEEEEESQQAFSAAEAGIEQALKLTEPGTYFQKQPLGGAEIDKVTVTKLVDARLLLNNNSPVIKDDGVDIWLSSYPDYSLPQWSGNLTVYWGSDTDDCQQAQASNTQAAIEVVLLTGPENDPAATHYVFDPCAPRRGENNFAASDAGVWQLLTAQFTNRVTITIDPAQPGLIARIIPLYASTAIGIEGDSPFPPQGSVIESVGKSGDSQHKIRVFRGFPKVPNEFFTTLLLVP